MTARAAFGVAILLGACLLFQVQFVLAKLILPWFGGSASVWSTSLVVFQVLLLAGYGYAHALAALPRRAQIIRHGIVIGITVALLASRAVAWPSPVTPGDAWKPDPDGSPVTQILLLLSGAVGLPFLVLASTSPLLQRWYADRYPARSPYRLYALSNLGSLVGLVSYPLLVEPRLDLFQQGRWWTAAYLAYAAATLVCTRSMRAVPSRDDLPAPEDRAPGDAITPPTAGDQVLWLLLAAVPAALLQATTTKLTQDVAALPFLWMVPLAIYLVTFIVAFELPRLFQRELLTLAVIAGVGAGMAEWDTWPMFWITLAVLGVTGWSFHGELASRAPAAPWLTRYYLLVSAGGALGSALVALGAPVAFDGLLEYPITLALTAVVLGLVYVVRAEAFASPTSVRLARVMGVALALVGAAVAGQTALGWRDLTSDAVFTSRNFFGALRVREQQSDAGETYRRLQHGTTLHGLQYIGGDKAAMPLTYYTPSSGVGQAMSALTLLGRPARVGVIGLGVGTMAAFGRPGDTFTFFEIDPQVVALSTAPTPLFRYLRDSKATVTIVGGDARLSLERARPEAFDLLAVDAFSSDAVPVHLLTSEAFALYARHLRSAQSVLAVHVSNRYLDLAGIVAAGGATAGFATVEVVNDLIDNDSERTTWMLLARDPAALTVLGAPWRGPSPRPWTDAFSNLLGVLRR